MIRTFVGMVLGYRGGGVLWIAVKMLVGDRVKYLALVMGVAFSTLLTVQQGSIFVGVMQKSAYLVTSNPDVDVWVTRTGVEATEWVQHMPDGWVSRVRSVPGVRWAVPMYRTITMARTEDQKLRAMTINGLDDATLMGLPADMIVGRPENLLMPDSVILDVAAFRKLFPDRALDAPATVELGKRRVQVVGVCRAIRSVMGGDQVFARRSVAVNLAQEPNDTVTFVLVKAEAEADPEAVAAEISARTGLLARSARGFQSSIMQWTIDNTGLVQVLGSVILLGIVIGVIVVAQTFHMFAYENARYFATFKAMGTTNWGVARMLSLQAGIVTFLGYGIGLGGATAILALNDTDLSPMRGLVLVPEVAVGVAVVLPVIVAAAALMGARKALTGEPGEVFRT